MLLACEPAGLWAVPLIVHWSDGQTSRFSGEPCCYARPARSWLPVD